MIKNVTKKETVFWLIFLAVVFFVGFWFVNFSKENNIYTNNSIFVKTTKIESDPFLV